MYLPNAGVDGFFNPAAFTDPAPVTNTKGARSRCSATPRGGWDAGRARRTSISRCSRISGSTERVNVQFRAEAFNLTNTPTFFLPAASNAALTLGHPNFGKLSSSSATGRQIQFGLKWLSDMTMI